MKYGYATQTATNEQFLNTCDAVKEFKEHVNHEGGEYFVFAYDESVEVPIVPSDIQFAQCSSFHDARWATR